jgi:hypothetical protein
MRGSKAIALTAVLGMLLTGLIIGGSSQAAPKGRFGYRARPGDPPLSGAASRRVVQGKRGVRTEAGTEAAVQAQVASDDIQVNGDNKADPFDQFGSGEGWPANETSIAVNPTDPSNVIAAANDYEAGVDSVQGLYASFDGGHTWPYSRHTRQVITPDRTMYGSGDPVVAFDRDGVAYTSFIAFGRADCASYVGVLRSPDKGVTWSTPADVSPEGSGLQGGDGIVVQNGGPDDCRIFHDKEWMTTGPRPAGSALVPGTEARFTSPDRIYVTWTRFDFGPGGTSFVDAPIVSAFSDDGGRHWSQPRRISGSARFCSVQSGDADGNQCDENQFSVPIVDPRTGTVYVAYENFNTGGDGQYLIVRSTNGGRVWSRPTRITTVFDGPDRYPVCQGSQTLDRMCARTNAAGNIDVNPNNGNLYLTFADNRNGTAGNTNTDVLVVRSTDGGQTWSTPLNITESSRDDQWFPWLSVAPTGTVAVTYFDRRYTPPKLIDTSLSQSTNGGTSFTTQRVSEVSWNPDLAFRLGTFIGDYNGLDTTATTALPFWTDARFAEPNVRGNNPPHQQSDVMTDVEPLRGS